VVQDQHYHRKGRVHCRESTGLSLSKDFVVLPGFCRFVQAHPLPTVANQQGRHGNNRPCRVSTGTATTSRSFVIANRSNERHCGGFSSNRERVRFNQASRDTIVLESKYGTTVRFFSCTSQYQVYVVLLQQCHLEIRIRIRIRILFTNTIKRTSSTH
jgi:hypothetical protein